MPFTKAWRFSGTVPPRILSRARLFPLCGTRTAHTHAEWSSDADQTCPRLRPLPQVAAAALTVGPFLLLPALSPANFGDKCTESVFSSSELPTVVRRFAFAPRLLPSPQGAWPLRCLKVLVSRARRPGWLVWVPAAAHSDCARTLQYCTLLPPLGTHACTVAGLA